MRRLGEVSWQAVGTRCFSFVMRSDRKEGTAATARGEVEKENPEALASGYWEESPERPAFSTSWLRRGGRLDEPCRSLIRGTRGGEKETKSMKYPEEARV